MRRRRGIQLGTIDALLARLCLRHDLEMLTTDDDFDHAARHIPLKIWSVGVNDDDARRYAVIAWIRAS